MALSDDALAQLHHEYSILHLLYHRNRNQHRALVWWKYLNMIHRYVRKILEISDKGHFRNKSEVLDNMVQDFLKKKIMDKAYWEFNSIIALGQFVTLGLVLVGLLAKVWSILEPERKLPTLRSEMTPAIQLTGSKDSKDTKGNPNIEEIGEEIILPSATFEQDKREEQAISELKTSKRPADTNIDDIFGNPKRKKTSDKKKKKKKKNDMDDIFG